jgi:hypothetical protein
MAVGCKVMTTLYHQFRRGLCAAVFAFLLYATTVHAAMPAPVLGESEWRTGEIEVCYSGVVPGATILLYTKTYKDSNFVAHDAWTAGAAAECYVSPYFENGQTVWHYIVQVDPATAEQSPPSNTGRQTPPITAYIINWPDMLGDLAGMINDFNESIQDKLDSLATPSDQAMDDLSAAIDNLSNAIGIGAVNNAGNAISGGLGQVSAGLSPPAVVDDGNGTFTGGSTGGQLPFPNQSNGQGLIAPNPDSGTDTELTMRIPYMVDMQGNLVYMKLFTAEQMEKMKWLGLLRTLAAATMFILFGFWLSTRFSPQLKA